MQTGDRLSARAHFETVLSACRALIEDAGTSIEAKRVSVLADYGQLLELEDEEPQACAVLSEAVMRARALARKADSIEHRGILAAVLWRSARMVRLQGRLEEAHRAACEALALYDRDAADGRVGEGELPRVHCELAELSRALGHPDEGLVHAWRARDHARAELQRRPSSSGRGRLLQATALLAEVQQELGHYGDAALTLDEGEALALEPAERADFSADLGRLARAREAQPKLM